MEPTKTGLSELFRRLSVDMSSGIEKEDQMRRLSLCDLQRLPTMHINPSFPQGCILQRLKVDFVGSLTHSSQRTALIRRVVYARDAEVINEPQEHDDEAIVYFCWLLCYELELAQFEDLAIDVWDLVFCEETCTLFRQLWTATSSVVVFVICGEEDVVSLREFVAITKPQIKGLKILPVIIKDTDDSDGAIIQNLTVLHQENGNDSLSAPVVLPHTSVQTHNQQSMLTFKRSLVHLCTEAVDNVVQCSASLWVLLVHLQQLRHLHRVQINHDQWQIEIDRFWEQEFPSEESMNHPPLLANLVPDLVKLREIWLVDKQTSTSHLGSSDTYILSPAKLVRAVTGLLCLPTARTLRIDSRRFWQDKLIRPSAASVAGILARAFDVGHFPGCLLPLIWQDLFLPDESLYQLYELLIKQGICLENRDFKEVDAEPSFIPKYTSFLSTFRISFPVFQATEEEIKIEHGVVADLSLRSDATSSLLRMLIRAQGRHYQLTSDEICWRKDGFSCSFQTRMITIQMVANETFRLSILRPHESTEQSNAEEQVLLFLINSITDICGDIEFSMKLTVITSGTEVYCTSMGKDDAFYHFAKVDDFLTSNNIEKPSIKESATREKSISEEVSRESSDEMKPPKMKRRKEIQSIVAEDVITPFDTKIGSRSHPAFQSDVDTDLPVVNAIAPNSTIDCDAYLEHIASTYVASIFTQAAVEVISLQVDDQHKALNRDPLVIAAQRDLMGISATMASAIQSGDFIASVRSITTVANAVQRAMKRRDQYNTPAKSTICLVS